MLKKNDKRSHSQDGVVLHINLIGALALSVALILGAALITYAVTKRTGATSQDVASKDSDLDSPPPAQVPPWGEIVFKDIRLEQPEEYLAFELENAQVPPWVFEGRSPDQVRALMVSCGLTQPQIERALSPAMMTTSASGTVIKVDGDLTFTLSPEARTRLYSELGHNAANQNMRFPLTYSGTFFDECFATNKVNPSVTAMVKQLLYTRGKLQCFSDYQVVLQRIPERAERLKFLQAISSQPAVLARVRIRPDTDIDKLLGYWAWPGGVRFKDVRPLLDSLKQVPEGGTISLMYLLPQFARQRLYTFPLPSKAGDPAIDCHWSTMNFFNEEPDDRFTDPAYTVKYLNENYYQVAEANVYGDVILFLDGASNNAIHSAVYLADDIVFTKNGNNMAQPWMLMHLKDLMAKYESDGPARTVIYRNKKW